jgi:hypothetical protein
MSRGTAEQLRADTRALVRHVLSHSKRDHITGQELVQIAALWAACYEVPEGAGDDARWAEFRVAYVRIMGDEQAHIGAFLRPNAGVG